MVFSFGHRTQLVPMYYTWYVGHVTVLIRRERDKVEKRRGWVYLGGWSEGRRRVREAAAEK